MTSHPGITVDPELVTERQQSMSCYVVTKKIDEAAVALLAVLDRLMLVDGEGHEWPTEEAALSSYSKTGHYVYTPNGAIGPETRQDGVLIWFDTKGDTSAPMAETMVAIIVAELGRQGVTEAHLRPITESDFPEETPDREPGLDGPDAEVEPLPVDADDREWVELNALLVGTGVPFEVMSPLERRNRAASFDEPLLRGRWEARWPHASRPAVVVALYQTEAEARAGYDRSVDLARQHVTPRDAYEVLRRGQTVVTLGIDHLNAAADEWLDRVRGVFANADARADVPRRQLPPHLTAR